MESEQVKAARELANRQFMNQMSFRIMDICSAARASGKPIKLPWILNVICFIFVLFWTIVIGGFTLLMLWGFIQLVFS